MIKNGTPIRTVAIIGAGPVGIAAAAHLIERGLRPTVLEKGARAGHALQQWGHVRLFTPWQYVIDKAVLRLLEKSGWQAPPDTHLPTGQELVDEYLAPAAATAELKGCLIYQANVLGVSKKGLSKSSSLKRADAPFTVHYETADGTHHIMEADAVIDASGTWDLPNPMGADGLKVPGESAHQDLISYGIPDILGKDKPTYDGKTSLVLGSGHSAINAVLDLLSLRAASPATKLIWGIRGDSLERLLGGGLKDELPARGALGIAAKRALNEGSLKMLASLRIRQINRWDNALRLEITAEGTDKTLDVDRVIAATGFRPQLELLSELRLDMDDTVQAPSQLAPMIDPNLHFCGSVKPHGVAELSHPAGALDRG
jgi:thioredoxin reductase